MFGEAAVNPSCFVLRKLIWIVSLTLLASMTFARDPDAPDSNSDAFDDCLQACKSGTPNLATLTPGRLLALSDPLAIDSSFFGMTIGTDVLKYPSVPIGAVGHPTLLAWGAIEAKKGTYNFNLYDKMACWASVNEVPFMVTFAWTPRWAIHLAPAPGCEQGFCTLPPDNMQDWTNFVTNVVQHYNGTSCPSVQYYELWNEFNDQFFWTGKMKDMVNMAEIASKIIRPKSMLLTPSVTGEYKKAAGWMTYYLKHGGKEFADGGTFHGYIAKNDGDYANGYPFPEDDKTKGGYGKVVDGVNTFRSVFDTYLRQDAPMFDTEGSWQVDTHITDMSLKVAWLARWYLLQAGTGKVKAAYWFAWGQSNPEKGDDQQWGGIADDNGVANDAGKAYGQVYNWLVGATMSPCSADSKNVWTCNMTRPNGYQGQAVWLYSTNEDQSVPYLPDTKYTQYRDLGEGPPTQIQKGDSVLIGPQPILLETGDPQ